MMYFQKLALKKPILIQPDLSASMKTFCGRCQKKSYLYVDNESSFGQYQIEFLSNSVITV